jgi:serine/threonine-protein kinase RsbW
LESKTFPGTLNSLRPIREYVESAAKDAGLGKKATYQLCLAVDEIATNIILYGYKKAKRPGMLDFFANVDENALTVRIEDDGEPFDPGKAKIPTEEDLEKPLEERPIGGLGLMLAIEGVDEFRYECANGRNRNIFIVNRQTARQSRTITE